MEYPEQINLTELLGYVWIYVRVLMCMTAGICILLFALDYTASAPYILSIVVSGDAVSAAASLCMISQFHL